MPSTRVKTLLVALGVGLATTCLMLATEPLLAIGWDEGYTLGREARLRDWFRALVNPARFAAQWQPLPLDRDLVQRDQNPPSQEHLRSRWTLFTDRTAFEWFWPFAREEPHGHPPFYALIGLIGDVIAPSWQVLPRAQLGPILLFSITTGVIYGYVCARWGTWAAALAAGSWVLQPNLFGHGHYAAYDAILTSLWILAIIFFASAVIPQEVPGTERRLAQWVWRIAFGVILGCAAATKFTGWFLPVPFLIWSSVYRSRRGFKTLLIGGLIALAVLLALMPPWWIDPINGVVRFFSSNLNRGKTRPIEVQFLGVRYNTPNESLPWYNTLVWTLFVTPVGFLIFAGTGIWAALRFGRSEPIGPLFVVHWAFLMALRIAPHAGPRRRPTLPAGIRSFSTTGRLRSPIPQQPVGPVGQDSHRPGHDRRNRQLGGDDASAFVIFQPSRGWTTRSKRPGYRAHVLLGCTRWGLAPVACGEHAGGRDHSVRHIPALVALPTRYRRITEALSGN